jgi:hypothetical protein
MVLTIAPPPAPDLRIELEAHRQSVAGLPTWITVTIRNAAHNLIESNLPPIPRIGSIPIGLAVRNAGRLIEIPAIDPSTRHGAPPGYALASGEARAFVVDLADVCPGLGPGDTEIAIALPGRRAIGRLSVQLLPPTDDERELTRLLLDEEGWLASMVLHPHEPELHWSTLSPRVRSAISMYAVLRRATWAARLSDVPLAIVRGLAGEFAGEATVLAYEIARSGGDPSAPEVRRDTAACWPALAWRLDEIDDDLGLLATLRELRELAHGPPTAGSSTRPARDR